MPLERRTYLNLPILRKNEASPFIERQITRNQQAFWVYTDSSKLQNSRTGAGWTALCAGKRIFSGSKALGPFIEVYNAKAEALLQGLRAALSHPLTAYMEFLYVCLDNLAVTTAIYRQLKGTSVNILRKCKDLLKKWEARPYLSAHSQLGLATVLWIPGHSGVPGNKAANQEASLEANHSSQHHSWQISTAGAHRWALTAYSHNFLSYRNSLPVQLRFRLDDAKLQPPNELQFPRYVLARLLAA